jgi:PAS domain S-box-containing protein
MADLNPDGLLVLDLEDREIVYVNHRVESLLGYSVAEVCEQGYTFFEAVLHPEEQASYLLLLEGCKGLQKGACTKKELRLRLAGGDWRWCSICHTPFKQNEHFLVYAEHTVLRCAAGLQGHR